jgi:hypothetical protein
MEEDGARAVQASSTEVYLRTDAHGKFMVVRRRILRQQGACSTLGCAQPRRQIRFTAITKDAEGRFAPIKSTTDRSPCPSPSSVYAAVPEVGCRSGSKKRGRWSTPDFPPRTFDRDQDGN